MDWLAQALFIRLPDGESLMNLLKNLHLRGKLAFIVGWAVASMLFLAMLSIWLHSRDLQDMPRSVALNVVEVATGVLDRYQKQEQAGALTREQAQKLALDTLRNMRYQDLYFIALDQNQRLLLHAARPDLEGQAAHGGRDGGLPANIGELVQLAQAGGGFLSYEGLAPGMAKSSQQTAYARYFAPWQWVLTTSVRADTASDSLLSLITRDSLLVAALALPLIFLCWRVIRNLQRNANGILELAHNLADGDLSHQAPVLSNDELGEMSHALNQSLSSLRAALQAEKVNWAELAEERQRAARVMSMVQSAPSNIMVADRQLRLCYVNPAMERTLRSLEAHLPMATTQLIGQPIDIFYSQQADLKRIVADPARLPHKALITLGAELCELHFSVVHDRNGAYLGPMITWTLVTEKLHNERTAKEANERQKEATEREKEANQREKEQTLLLQTKADRMLKVVNAAAAGDLTQELAISGNDTIDRMGQGLDQLLATLRDSMARIGQTAQTLASAAEELTSVSEQMGSNAEAASFKATQASATADQVNLNVEAVATATEEMSASIREIALNAAEAAKVVASAVTMAQSANTTVRKLGESSAGIGNIIKVITSIAEQTHLLALNATIEAARAGEAGKGFAVVANEVKELAKETAKATEEIGRKIEAIQMDTGSAVDAIGGISSIINQINDIQITIASAVEQQTATTNEIGRSVAEAARGSTEITHNINNVVQATQHTLGSANDVHNASSEMARMAAELQQQVDRFRYGPGSFQPGVRMGRGGIRAVT
jgi:methyl-accepting chemotaxis protein